ncbi:hypothetical protein B7494_g4886 [Chlorociboria aeruginascens]|nr:hypothetical protein B7494_g4886 [Chlorociboria aeruginascens]
MTSLVDDPRWAEEDEDSETIFSHKIATLYIDARKDLEEILTKIQKSLDKVPDASWPKIEVTSDITQPVRKVNPKNHSDKINSRFKNMSRLLSAVNKPEIAPPSDASQACSVQATPSALRIVEPQRVQFQVANDQTSAEEIEEIENLCLAISAAYNQASWCRVLVVHHEKRQKIRAPSKPCSTSDNIKMVTLAEVLQLYQTPWLGDSWGKETFALYKKRMARCSSIDLPLDPMFQQKAPKVSHSKRTLLMFRLIEKMNTGTNLENVLKRCVQPDGVFTNLTNQEVRDMVEKNIIVPLENEVLWLQGRERI